MEQDDVNRIHKFLSLAYTDHVPPLGSNEFQWAEERHTIDPAGLDHIPQSNSNAGAIAALMHSVIRLHDKPVPIIGMDGLPVATALAIHRLLVLHHSNKLHNSRARAAAIGLHSYFTDGTIMPHLHVITY
jgi:hypothetical protein